MKVARDTWLVLRRQILLTLRTPVGFAIGLVQPVVYVVLWAPVLRLALKSAGVTSYAAAFRAYVEQVLAPELEPGDAVVMDNLSPHKVAGVQEAIRAAGASVLYLPSYSPDFNPIEQLFAKLKTLLRKAAARTQDALWETIGTSLEDFTLTECHNYIVNSGYEFV